MEVRKPFIALALRRARSGSGSAPGFLDQRTWSLPVSDLRSIVQRTRFVVVGGVATRLYMPERMTRDVDFWCSSRTSRRSTRNCGTQVVDTSGR